MFQRLGVARYKRLQWVDVTLGPFTILIGPNARGKSTLLDGLAFLHDALSSNAEQAVRQSAGSLRELVWKHANVEQGFEIAVEAPLPACPTPEKCISLKSRKTASIRALWKPCFNLSIWSMMDKSFWPPTSPCF